MVKDIIEVSVLASSGFRSQAESLRTEQKHALCKLTMCYSEFEGLWMFESGVLKGHWTTSASSPIFFKKSWDFYTIGSVYPCSDCMLNLVCNFNWITKICEFFLWRPFLKVYFKKWPPLSWLLNLAPATIILVWRKILMLVLWTVTKIKWTLCKLWHFGLEKPCFKQQHE